MKKILALALCGGFLLVGCNSEQPKHKFDHERRSTNIEDVRLKSTLPRKQSADTGLTHLLTH